MPSLILSKGYILIGTLTKAFDKINGYIFNRKLISRLLLSCSRIPMLHKNKMKPGTFHNRIFSLIGVRQEQDIYVRLIDSVTKQVLYIYFLINLTILYIGCSHFDISIEK